MRIGVFGGTFDPPHIGHLIVAQEVHFRLGLDRVLWVPAAVPPHKIGQDMTAATIRLDLVRAAIGDDDRFRVSDAEIRRDGPSYTVDTLRELRTTSPGDDLYLVVGADQLAELDTWREPGEIRRLATVVGFARSGKPALDVTSGHVVEVPRVDVSSTEIRRRIAAEEPVAYLMPASVESVVLRERLYRAASSP